MEGGGMSGGGLQRNMLQGMLGLDMHQQQQQQQIHQQQRHRQQPPPPQQLLPFPSQPQTQKQHTLYALPSSTKQPKQQHQHQQTSPEDHQEHDTRHPAAAAAAPASPWQRMKWTDSMVKLLITIVYCVGDEAGADHPSSSSEAGGVSKVGVGKKTGNQSLPQQQQQKKGKWKSVSKAMMDRGYSVSPQQCEDKFNDLNKRYKRVNDILGRGTACRVVENQVLLDAMDHLSPKAKEEARKLLNSKHLFYKEMCAYHSSCTAAAAGGAPPGGGPPNAVSAAFTITSALHQPAESTEPSGQQQCFHPAKMAVRRTSMPKEEEGDEDNEEDDYDDDDDDDDHDDEEDGGVTNHHGRRPGDDGEEEEGSKAFMLETETTTTTTSSGTKRQRRSSWRHSASPPATPPASQQLRCELMSLTGPVEQQRQWLRRRVTELEESKVEYQRRALALERQKFKWQRFSGNKEREMEKTKIRNERLRLDSERMLLLLRQKELDLTFGPVANGGGTGNHAPVMVVPVQQQQAGVFFQQPTRSEPGSIQREN